jgi:broad specificity phosphatase PhoE
LVRHPAVAVECRGLCYGASDVPLGPDGRSDADRLAAELHALGPTAVVHSGLARAAAVADRLAALAGLAPTADPRLRERHFGAWELRSWDAIYAETGDAMMGTVTDPAGWRPPGGETTFELRDRVVGWYRGLPPGGVTVAVCHGGPIAALLGTLRGVPAADWPGLIPPPGGVVTLARGG